MNLHFLSLEYLKFCDKIKIEFLATPFDNESADFLEEIKVRLIKVSSGILIIFFY